MCQPGVGAPPLNTQPLISDRQFGFRSGFWTQEALLSVTNDWHQLLASNHQVGTVFFDMKKAFDSVPRNHSLAKIRVSGSFLSWFNNYLSGHCIEGVSSPLSQVTSGVPQGSILGPLLFMDSILKSPFSPNAKLALYADEIVLHKPNNSEQDVHALQDDISEWCRDHGLVLNSAKADLLPITHSPYPGLAIFIFSPEPPSAN